MPGWNQTGPTCACTGSTRWKQRSWPQARDTGGKTPHNHRAKVESARRLHAECGLPDIADLLIDLNTGRKAETYGDVDGPQDLEAEDVASAVEEYIELVGESIEDTGEE